MNIKVFQHGTKKGSRALQKGGYSLLGSRVLGDCRVFIETCLLRLAAHHDDVLLVVIDRVRIRRHRGSILDIFTRNLDLLQGGIDLVVALGHGDEPEMLSKEGSSKNNEKMLQGVEFVSRV